jgi:hypothetical protein
MIKNVEDEENPKVGNYYFCMIIDLEWRWVTGVKK